MLPLLDPAPPASGAELATALRQALAALVAIPPAVTAEGDWPRLRLLAIDLSGGKIPTDFKFTPAAGPEVAAFQAERVELKGQPIRFQDAQANLAVNASGIDFRIQGSSAGALSLAVTAVETGQFSLSMARQGLEALIRSVAQKAADGQGVDIETVRLEISADGPSAVTFRARVIAHKLFMSTAISLQGRLAVDASLAAHLSQLSCDGSGMIGSVACNFIRPYLERLNGRAFPLAGFALGETRVTEVRLDPGEPLRITAAFGKSAGA